MIFPVIGSTQTKEEKNEVLPMSIVTEFWLSAVNSFGALYEAVFKSVYSRKDKAKLIPQVAKQCVAKILESFLGLAPFTQLTLFDEGEMALLIFEIRLQEQ